MSAVRLNAYLARAGIASRRGADDLIKAGRVLVNGEPLAHAEGKTKKEAAQAAAKLALERLTTSP